MIKISRRGIIKVLSAIGIATTVGLPTLSQAAPVDFAGKTVEIIVPYTEGGGTDVYVRLLAPFLQKYLPGQPTIVVRNFPGGASIMGSNRFEARAKPDGLSIIATSSSTSVAQVMGGDDRQFDLLTWRQIIVTSLGTVVYFAPQTGVTGKDPVADIRMLLEKHTKLLYGAKQPNAAEIRIILALDLLGLNFETIFNVARGEVREAMLRGEMQVNDDTSGAFLDRVMPLVKRGELVPMFTLGSIKDGKLTRDPIFPDLITIGELYEGVYGKAPSGEIWDALKRFIYLAEIGAKGLALPKGTPDNIRDAYVAALQKTIADDKFKQMARDLIGDYPHVLGDEADAVIDTAVNLPPATKDWLAIYLKKKFDVVIK